MVDGKSKLRVYKARPFVEFMGNRLSHCEFDSIETQDSAVLHPIGIEMQ